MPFSLKDAILQQPADVAGARRARTVEEEDAIRAARTPAQRRLENAISLLFGTIGLPTSDSDEQPNQWARAGELLSAAMPVAGPLRAASSVRIPRKMSAEALHSGMPQKLNAGAVKFPMPEQTPRGATLTVMSPQEYLRQVNEAQGINFESAPPPIRKPKTIRNLVRAIKSGESIETPWLTLRQGKIADQEGRHRAVAAIEAGVNEIPVFVFERK